MPESYNAAEGILDPQVTIRAGVEVLVSLIGSFFLGDRDRNSLTLQIVRKFHFISAIMMGILCTVPRPWKLSIGSHV